jgi:hypothetical protein
VQYTPVVEDYVMCSVSSSSAAGLVIRIEYIRSILPGLSWNQYTLFGWLRRASNLLTESCQLGLSHSSHSSDDLGLDLRSSIVPAIHVRPEVRINACTVGRIPAHLG